MPFVTAFVLSTAAHFPAWEPVTPQTLTRHVPEYTYSGVPGSVQPREYLTQRQLPTCPIYDDDGRVIGFALGCLRNLK